MKLNGEALIAAPRSRVWEAINDPEILRQCIPGCEEIVRETPVDWLATVVTRVGPVKARFNGKIRLEDLQAPASCRIVGEGSGGAAGFAKGSALVSLTDDGDATRLAYTVESEIGGKLAQIGSRLIEAFARKYAAEFFDKFGTLVGQGEQGTLSLAQPAIPAAETAAVASSRTTPRLPVIPVNAPSPARRFDSQSFVIIVLAALLVFMTVMYAFKP